MAKVEVAGRVPAKAKPKITASVTLQLHPKRRDSKRLNLSRKSTVSSCFTKKREPVQELVSASKNTRASMLENVAGNTCAPVVAKLGSRTTIAVAWNQLPERPTWFLKMCLKVLLSLSRVLLVSCRKHEDEFLSSWESFQSLLKSPSQLQLIHYVFEDSSDDLVIFLDLLDRIKTRFFHLACVLPPALHAHELVIPSFQDRFRSDLALGLLVWTSSTLEQ